MLFQLCRINLRALWARAQGPASRGPRTWEMLPRITKNKKKLKAKKKEKSRKRREKENMEERMRNELVYKTNS